MSKLIHFKCDKFAEFEGEKISLTKTTPLEAPSRKSLEDKITDLFKVKYSLCQVQIKLCINI